MVPTTEDGTEQGDATPRKASSWLAGARDAVSRGRGSGSTEETAGGAGSTSRTVRSSGGTATFARQSEPVGRTGGAGAPANGSRGPRRIRLTLSRIDPFSVMKLSFLLSLGIALATVIATAILWNMVDAMHVFDRVGSMLGDVSGGKASPIMDFLSFSKVLSYSIVVSVVDIFIITALGTLFAFLYNIVAGLLGGLKVTFTDQ